MIIRTVIMARSYVGVEKEVTLYSHESRVTGKTVWMGRILTSFWTQLAHINRNYRFHGPALSIKYVVWHVPITFVYLSFQTFLYKSLFYSCYFNLYTDLFLQPLVVYCRLGLTLPFQLPFLFLSSHINCQYVYFWTRVFADLSRRLASWVHFANWYRYVNSGSPVSIRHFKFFCVTLPWASLVVPYEPYSCINAARVWKRDRNTVVGVVRQSCRGLRARLIFHLYAVVKKMVIIVDLILC